MYFHLKQSKRGKQRNYFVLHANNGEPVGTSEMYSDEQAARQGAAAMLKATCEYWKEALATLIEEKAQAAYEESAKDFNLTDVSSLLLSLTNEDMQKIIDRIPYQSK